jgi:hypothetical protein
VTEQVFGSLNTLELLNTHACTCKLLMFLFSTVADTRLISIILEAQHQVVGKVEITRSIQLLSPAVNNEIKEFVD